MFQQSRWRVRPWWFTLAGGSACIVLILTGMTVGYPRAWTDWYFRPQFVEFCVIGARGRMDDQTITACNAAYERRAELKERGWR